MSFVRSNLELGSDSTTYIDEIDDIDGPDELGELGELDETGG